LIDGTVRNLVLFGVMSLIWGLTWAAIKFGLAAGVPPILLAASWQSVGSLPGHDRRLHALSAPAEVVGHGASRPFISPIIALAAGAWLFGETISLAEIGGIMLLLSAAGVALSHGARLNNREDRKD
jgi:O-acetylserine/cysteine efflux transporter